MADNVDITPGTGKTIATDDIGGVQYQRVKVALGADGAAADLAPGQAAMASSVPVAIASDQSAINITGTRANAGSDTAAGKSHLTVGGTDGTNLRPMSVDSSGRPNVNVNGTVPVSGSVTANAGTNLDTSALALESGGNLATLVARTPVLGQAAAASSSPVALANEQILDQYITGAANQLTLGNNVILASAGSGSTDCQQYRSLAITITPAAGTVTAGNITFEASNDNVNFVPLPLYDVASPNNLPISTYAVVASTTRYFAGTALFRYIRARISTGITGTTTGVRAFTILSMAPFFPAGATQVVNQTAANLNANVSATNLSCNTAQINGVAPLMGNGVTGTGSLRVTIASDTTANTNPYVTKRPTPTQSFINSAATTNATSIKASAGTVFGIICNNNGAAVAFVKFYNKASAPTVGTDVPVFWIAVPAGGQAEFNCGAYGHQFGTGIALAITNLVADTDTTAVAASQVKVATSYV